MFSEVALNETCTTSCLCAVDVAICVGNKCVCPEGYIEMEGDCIKCMLTFILVKVLNF